MDERAVSLCAVENLSKRPVRDVRAFIRTAGVEGVSQPSTVADLNGVNQGLHLRQRRVEHPREDDRQALLRWDEACVFVFPFSVNEFSGAEMSVEFTDDAGLRWRIDCDLHLERLDEGRSMARSVFN